MFRKTCAALLATAFAAIPLIGASGATAATQIGSACVGTRAEMNLVTLVPLATPVNPGGTTIPTAGVITSWGVSVIPYPGGISEKLKVFRPAPGLNTFTAVGESTMQPIVGGLNRFETRIPVQAGDRIGVTSSIEAIYCGEAEEAGEESSNIFGTYPSDVPLGGNATFDEYPHGQVAVSATLEPDADGDGFGDETQDKCPTNASTQGPCPTPPPPPTPILLSASSAAGKGLVTLTVTSTAQATVSVGGSVKLGNGKSAKLNGGTQLVAPGSLAKFIILFPAKLKAKLKQLTTKQSVSLKLAVSAPGATTKKLTVKAKGQKAAKPQRRKK